MAMKAKMMRIFNGEHCGAVVLKTGLRQQRRDRHGTLEINIDVHQLKRKDSYGQHKPRTRFTGQYKTPANDWVRPPFQPTYTHLFARVLQCSVTVTVLCVVVFKLSCALIFFFFFFFQNAYGQFSYFFWLFDNSGEAR